MQSVALFFFPSSERGLQPKLTILVESGVDEVRKRVESWWGSFSFGASLLAQIESKMADISQTPKFVAGKRGGGLENAIKKTSQKTRRRRFSRIFKVFLL